MMEGTYYKEWSAVLDREMEFKVYGHGGVPVLSLIHISEPTRH